MYRVQLAENSTAQKPKIKKFGLVNGNYKELLGLAHNKFQFNQNKIRLFVSRDSLTTLPGTEITKDSNVEDILNDDVVIVVSNNQEYKGKNVQRKFGKDHMKLADKLVKPPRWPYPGCVLKQTPLQKMVSQESTSVTASTTVPQTVTNYLKNTTINKEMMGLFPLLEGNVYMGIKKAISTNEKIKLLEYDGYASFDYSDDVTFPPVVDWESAVQRECRGLIVSTHTGHVLARRYHKFFNINQNSECLLEHIDFSEGIVHEKLDGSLVSPVLLDNGKLIWATRRQQITDAEEFVENSNINYNDFSRESFANGNTPLFEWCNSSKPSSVISYNESMLILLGIRNNVTGEYISIKSPYVLNLIQRFNIPCVTQHEFNDITTLKSQIESCTDREGVVISVPSGQKYKLKCFWYVYMCSASKSGGANYFLPELLRLRPTLIGIPAEKIWITALENIDDVIGLCVSLLNETDGGEFVKFIEHIHKNVSYVENDLKHWVMESFSQISIKEPIYALAASGGWEESIIDGIFKGNSVTSNLISLFTKLGKSLNVNHLNAILDTEWDIEKGKMNTHDSVLDITTFDSALEELKEHVLNVYIPKKFSNILGVKSLCDNSTITFQRNYTGDEGKIKGMWEQFTKNDIYDLRIDIQPPVKTEYTFHNGNLDYALILVQYGLFNNNNKKPFGSFAGVLVPTEYDVPIKYIISAFEQSFLTQKLIKMKHRHTTISKYKIFCDLDGVLVDFEKGVVDVTGRGTHEQTVTKMWNRILTFPKFFEQLNWTSYGRGLWESILNISNSTPTILTGLPYSCKKKVHNEKRIWCQKHLGENVNVITTQSVDKYKYSSYGHVLIDDRYSHKKLWETYGGTFIYHTSLERTLYELNRLFNKIDKIQLDMNITSTLEPYVLSQTIHFITDFWPNITENIVGIDAEWNSKSTSGVSIIQLATYDSIYIIDILTGSDLIKERMENLLGDSSVLKIGFGMDMSDIDRIGCDINNLIDLQETMIDCVVTQYKKDSPSLSSTVANVLGKNMHKSTEFQLSNWDMRPLSQEQLEYAGMDSIVLLDIYKKLSDKISIPAKSIVCDNKSKSKFIPNDEFDPLQSVEIIYSGIFLSPQSRQDLLNKFPYIHQNKHSTHCTLIYKPTEYETRGLPVGDTVELLVTGKYYNDKVQAVRCVYNDKTLHVTISTQNLVSPNESNNIKEDDWVGVNTPFKLFGTVGLVVSEVEDTLVLLPERIRTKILNFQENAEVSQSLKFKPGELSTVERAHIHEYVTKHNIESKSSGKENSRKLILTMKRKKKYEEDECVTKIDKIRRITDHYQFSMLNIISNNSILPTIGKLEQNCIQWSQNVIMDERTIYVLRGLPGSGKSTLAKTFAQITNSSVVICSADSYFEVNKLKFNTKFLDDAHMFCFTQAVNAVKSNVTHIVIDNTNTMHREFRKYIKLGEDNSYNIKVLEISCQDKTMAKLFASRNAHKVPVSVVLKMLSRWETYDNALLIEPYENSLTGFNEHDLYDSYDLSKNNTNVNTCGTLLKWAQDNKVIHSNTRRNRTHLLMGVDTMQPMFLSIPLNLLDDFYNVYIHGGIHGNATDEPKFITEITQEKFRMFFDIDHVGNEELSTDEILWIIKIIQQYVTGLIYVTGCVSTGGDGDKVKTGLHLKCPSFIVDHVRAKNVRNDVVEALYLDEPNKNWEGIVDNAIYGGSTGIRMFGSRKTTKGIDKGRVYKLYFVVNEDGEYYKPEMSDLELIKILSIHT